MNKYTIKNTVLKDAINKASQKSRPLSDLVHKASKNRKAKQYRITTKHVKKAKPSIIQPVTIKDDIHTRDGIVYNLNPSQADYESVKLMAKEKMLSYICNFVATRETYLYNSDASLKLTPWTDFYLQFTHDINAYQQSYRLAKMIIDASISYTENPLFDASMQHIKRDVWDILIANCDNEHDAIVTGWIITKIIHKAVQQNGYEFSRYRKEYASKLKARRKG